MNKHELAVHRRPGRLPIDATMVRSEPAVTQWLRLFLSELGGKLRQAHEVDIRSHADAWLAAWNGHDLDAIMACYSDDVDFVASTAVTRWGREDGRLRGKAELRRHFELGLDLAPDLVFTEEMMLTNPVGYALLYKRENGNRVLDVVELDSSGQAANVKAFYESAQR